MATCYRHPNRETGVSCSNCGRPICPDCMTPTSVGMRCPECSRERTKVKTVRSLQSEPRVTYALIAINVIVFLAQGNLQIGTGGGGGQVFDKGALYGPLIEIKHEYWRLVTGGFLHSGLLHIGFNMYLLYVLGRMLEPALGSVRFGLLYFAALLAGSAGALIVTPHSPTVGASGAVFGLMGATFLELRARGINPMAGGLLGSIGGLIIFNLVLSFSLSGISIGGHIGGLIGGALVTLVYQQADRFRQPILGLVGAVAIGIVAVAISLAAAAASV
ncbi:MAG: Rhomboid family protein [Solirubrobacteraceae bacterium]|nr:Rhomboid family protein [Solirubrobacteraceae bacterium]